MSKYEYSVCWKADNGSVISMTTSTVSRYHAYLDLESIREKERALDGDPDQYFVGRRGLPVWSADRGPAPS